MTEEGGLKDKIKRAQSGQEGSFEELGKTLEGEEGVQSMESEGKEEDPKQGAVNLLLEGKMSVADIAAQTGLSPAVVGGLKGQLSKKGYLLKEKPGEGPLPEVQRPLSAEEQMQKEAMRTLKEELASAPGCSEGSLSWILRRFERDPSLSHNPNQLHTLLRNTCPRMDDFIIEQVVDEVLKTVESFHLERIRAPFPNYHTRPQQGYRQYADYGYGQPTHGSEEQRFYTGADLSNERRMWGLESKVERLDSGLESINRGLEDLNKKLDEKPKTLIEDESVKRLEDRIERLQEDLTKKDKELDQRDKQVLKDQLAELKQEVHGLRNNLGEWKTDEFKLFGEGLSKLADFGKEVMKEAPLAKAAKEVASAIMPTAAGPSQEVPAEARKTVIEVLKGEGYTVPE